MMANSSACIVQALEKRSTIGSITVHLQMNPSLFTSTTITQMMIQAPLLKRLTVSEEI